MKQILLVIFVILLGGQSYANDPVKPACTLQGAVTDMANNENLSGVKVCVAGSNLVTFTDRDGQFKFENLPAGEITLEFSLVSFTKKTEKVSVSQDTGNFCVALSERE